ncbi:MAG: xylF 2, partial [Hyphomicrobiales bacterium]|nr:xylF 2 [Hyphomicrobiales bacterium]
MKIALVVLALLALVGAGAYVFTQWEVVRFETRYPPRGSFVEADGVRLHYTEMAAQGPARGVVLLLHGASGNQADVMLPLGPGLAAQGFRVLAFDRPGHGWSKRPPGDEQPSPAMQVDRIRAGLAKLGVDQAIVVGHSLAGALAANFAIDHQKFTRGLVLIAPVTHPWPGGVTWYYEWSARPWIGKIFANLLAMPVGLAILDKAVASVFAPQTPPADYIERIGAPLVLRPDNFIANAQDVAHLDRFIARQAPRMHEITAPTTIITGDHDGVVYAHLHSLGSARDIAGSKLITLQNVGHAVQNVAPDKVIAAIVEVAQRADARVAHA